MSIKPVSSRPLPPPAPIAGRASPTASAPRPAQPPARMHAESTFETTPRPGGVVPNRGGGPGGLTQKLDQLRNTPAYSALPEGLRLRTETAITTSSDPVQTATNMQRLVASPGFSGLGVATQEQLLGTQLTRPGDSRLAGELSSLASDTSFQGLTAAHRTEVLNGISTHGNAEAYLRSLGNDAMLTLAEAPGGAEKLGALRSAMASEGLTTAEQAQVDRIDSATFTPGAGLTVQGSDADKGSYLHMVRREMLASPSFRTLMNTINADSAHPITVNAGRSQPGIFVDGFQFPSAGQQTIDLDDFEQWPLTPPAGNPDAMARGQNLVHAMAEAYQGALGNGYAVSHTTAINAENQYRRDIGQTSQLRLPPNDTATGPGGEVIFQYDNGYQEQTRISGSTITGITRVNPSGP